jgi:hypothetical protein
VLVLLSGLIKVSLQRYAVSLLAILLTKHFYFQDTAMKTTRRQFIIYSAAGLATLPLAQQANAQAMLGEAEPQAVGLGYKALATAVDKAKFPKYADGQVCSNCQLYVSKSPEAGTCAIFPGKLVAGPGWCNAWVKKA